MAQNIWDKFDKEINVEGLAADVKDVNQMIKKIIDVSEWQGKINWELVKPQIDGAILRCGYGSDFVEQDDSTFEYNSTECERLAIPYSVYLYSYANNEQQAKSEANHIIRLIKGRKIFYPVYYDLEHEPSIQFATKAISIVQPLIEQAGYKFGVYANLSWWESKFDEIENVSRWVAQWNETLDFEKPTDIWQYTSTGRIKGIDGNVDLNNLYTNFNSQNPLMLSVDELKTKLGVSELFIKF